MSSDIWTRCGGRSNRCVLDARPWRVVEEQYRSSTWKLVNSQEEHDLLEALVEESKPPLPLRVNARGHHFLLFTPFRYPPLRHGSRFGSFREPAPWYGSDQIRTALAEDSYYRLYLAAGSAAKLTPYTISRYTFQAHVRTDQGTDLTSPAFAAHRRVLRSRTDYSATQAAGAAMRAAGVLAFRFASALDTEGGTNVGVFSLLAFASKKILAAPRTWQCTVTDAGVAYEYVGVTRDAHFFPVSQFLVSGKLPAPAP
jgi:hypothetical protein